jgi:hypothetical protein
VVAWKSCDLYVILIVEEGNVFIQSNVDAVHAFNLIIACCSAYRVLPSISSMPNSYGWLDSIGLSR